MITGLSIAIAFLLLLLTGSRLAVARLTLERDSALQQLTDLQKESEWRAKLLSQHRPDPDWRDEEPFWSEEYGGGA